MILMIMCMMYIMMPMKKWTLTKGVPRADDDPLRARGRQMDPGFW